MKEMVVLSVTEPSQAAQAKRSAQSLARSLEFDETEAGKVAIVASEMATNLAKHAKGGEFLICPLECGGALGLEVMALDKGPGMANVAKFLRNGYSTTGSLGTGMGAIMRLSSSFDIYSLPGTGTALLARLWAKPLPENPSDLDYGVISLAKPGERVRGDAWAVDQSPGRSIFMVADGLGHGGLAAEAAMKAVEIFKKNQSQSPSAIIEAAHGALHHTRGAAVVVVEIDVASRMVHCAGVGNITGIILSSIGSRALVSHNGIVGHQSPKIQEFTYPWPERALMVLHSDGLTSRWSFDHYPGLTARHPSLIAGVLYRDFNRGNDDLTVLVARAQTAPEARDVA